MTLAPYVQILGRGPGRSRSLTQDEAQEAMQIILRGEAAPEAIGAMLMLLRMKGETAEELAGFVRSARQSVAWQGAMPALDWPSYAAGRTRGLPWFLLSAKLVAQAGYPVLLHGWNSHQNRLADVRAALAGLSIPTVSDPASAQAALEGQGIGYAPLEALSPGLFDLLGLRDVLGLRSCINTVLRLLNPCGAGASVQGVFHPSYREVQADACLLLGQQSLSVIKGGGGEFERHPGKDIQGFGLRGGAAWEQTFTALQHAPRRLSEGASQTDQLAALWHDGEGDAFDLSVVLGTAAMALDTLGVADARAVADHLWATRHTAKAA